MSEIEVVEAKWKARLERERESRKESERLLEQKSAELYELNQSLEKKIVDELDKNRDRELMVFQQSKMAAMGEMIGNIAHQWRQPLSAISSTASANILRLELGMLSDEDAKQSLEEIIGYTKFLSSTIDDFRNFFRNDKESVNFFVEDCVEKVLSILSGLISSNSITIIKEVENIELYNLQNEFIQVILNILKNSIDAFANVQRESEKKVIFIRAYEENNLFVFTITDTAGGVPDTIIEKIFEPYFTTKHQSQGTGIGLFMTSEIVVKHMHGMINVENIETNLNGENFMGASFKIILPLIEY